MGQIMLSSLPSRLETRILQILMVLLLGLNIQGLKLAREVDPEGVRTIGVLTKVDLMDDGTDVVDILAGRVIPLRLGYVPEVKMS
jgi:hypothetical protein